jgi:hypothetical protein
MIINEKTKYLIEKLSKSIIDEPIDEKIIPLINAINEFDGIQTDVCCEGHGVYFPYLFFTIDGSKESLSGLGLISHFGKEFNWLVNVVTTGKEKKQFYFAFIPIKIYSYNSGSNVIKVKGNKDDIESERNKISFLSETIYKYAKNEKSELRKPLINKKIF